MPARRLRLGSVDPALLAAVVVGVVVRVVWCAVAVRPHVGQHDPAVYARLADDIVHGRGYRAATGAPSAYYPVGYPALLAVAWWFGSHLDVSIWTAAAALNIVAAAATIAAVGVLGGRLVGRRVGIVAALAVALMPNLVVNSAAALTESSFLALATGAVVVLGVGRQAPPRRPVVAAVGAGVLFGLAGLVRPVGLVLVLVVVLVAAVGAALGRRRRPVDGADGGAAWATGRSVALVVLGVLVVCLPWMGRNQARLGRFTLATSTGDNLCIGNNPSANGAFQLPDACFADVPDLVGGDGEAERDRILTSRAVRWAADHAGAQPRLVWQRTFWTLRSDHDGLRAVQSYESDPWLTTYHPTVERLLRVASDAAWWVVLAGAVAGAASTWRRRLDRHRTFVLLAPLALLTAVWPFFGDTRFHLPMVPFLVLPAAAFLDGLIDRVAPARGEHHEHDGGQAEAVHVGEGEGPAEAGRRA